MLFKKFVKYFLLNIHRYTNMDGYPQVLKKNPWLPYR